MRCRSLLVVAALTAAPAAADWQVELSVTVTPYSDAPVTVSCDLDGLAEALAELDTHCSG